MSPNLLAGWLAVENRVSPAPLLPGNAHLPVCVPHAVFAVAMLSSLSFGMSWLCLHVGRLAAQTADSVKSFLPCYMSKPILHSNKHMQAFRLRSFEQNFQCMLAAGLTSHTMG